MLVWVAPPEVCEIVESVKNKHMMPRLAEASIAVCFQDVKPFTKDGRFNFGKTQKFSKLAQLWHGSRHDFLIQLPAEAWHNLLNMHQREAWIDLRLRCCQVEYVPEVHTENGAKKPVTDEFGRIQYTEEIKRDEEGNPKWRVVPLDLQIFTENVAKYGLWCEDLSEFKEVLAQCEKESAA